jgi:hypothetical protein
MSKQSKYSWFSLIPKGMTKHGGHVGVPNKKLTRKLSLTVHQHGGDDVTCKPRIAVYVYSNDVIATNTASSLMNSSAYSFYLQDNQFFQKPTDW